MESEMKPTNAIAQTVVKLKTEVDLFSKQIEKNNAMIKELEPSATWESWPEEPQFVPAPGFDPESD
jgi:hypothetical protein